MTAPSGSGAAASTGKAPKPPQYRHFTDFVTTWLLPTINVRLAEANRENTYTWCERWWAHRAVAVRFGALDQPVVAGGPDFAKSLSIDHATV